MRELRGLSQFPDDSGTNDSRIFSWYCVGCSVVLTLDPIKDVDNT